MGRTRRIFSREFKIDLVNQLLAGKPVSPVTRENDLHPTLITHWKREYSQNPEKAISGHGNPYKDTARIAEPERLVGKLYSENEFLRKALETLGKQNGDERKKTVTPQVGNDPLIY